MNVLFIGNSHIRYNSLVSTVERFGGIKATAIIENGATFETHYNNANTRAAITNGPGGGKPWDWVVLQPNSLEPVLVYPGGEGTPNVNKANFIEYGVLLANLATNGKYGPSKTLLFQVAPKGSPWNGTTALTTAFSVSWYSFDFDDVGANPPDMQRLMVASFKELRDDPALERKDLAWICPIGEAWLRSGLPESFLWSRSELATVSGTSLYRSDWNHPSPVGSYAMALTLWRWMTRRNTLCLPPVTGQQADRQPDYGAGQLGLTVTHPIARQLQCVVDGLPVLATGFRCPVSLATCAGKPAACRGYRTTCPPPETEEERNGRRRQERGAGLLLRTSGDGFTEKQFLD